MLRRWRPREVVDAIEANALLGGRMSVGDSLGLVAATLLSGGFGASVGLEAAYTQLGAALASRLGRWVELRRDDVRTLVGCGAAGAIAAAFNAPLTGAFYAFELIIGSLHPADPGAGRHRRPDRGVGGPRARRIEPDIRGVARNRDLGLRLPGLFCRRPRLGGARHPRHEGGDLDRSPVPVAGGAALGAAGARRAF